MKVGLERSGRTWDDIDIASSGYLALGENDEEISRSLDQYRKPLSFYGSTRSYHHVLRLHGLVDLGMRLHKLSLDGRWQEMQDIITEDDLLKLAETCTYDDYPAFVRNNREYASQMGFGFGGDNTPDRKDRAQALMKDLQSLKTPGVPVGLEF